MKFLRAFLLYVTAVVAGSAQAAPPILVDKRVVLAEFADCLASMGPAQSEALLRSPPATDAERHAAETLVHAHSSCMAGRMVLSMNAPIIRGLVAEAMFKRRHPDWLASAERMPASAPQRPARPVESRVQKEPSDLERERAFMAAYSGCLANALPAQVSKVLATGIATPEERDAVLALGTDLNDCMSIGARYQLNIGGLRANLASALYREMAARNGPEIVK